MATSHPADIGGAEIDSNDPFALTQRIQYLARHEMPFTEFESKLGALVQRTKEYQGTAYEEFLGLLEVYRQALEGGGAQAADFRDKVVNFSGHRGAGAES